MICLVQNRRRRTKSTVGGIIIVLILIFGESRGRFVWRESPRDDIPSYSGMVTLEHEFYFDPARNPADAPFTYDSYGVPFTSTIGGHIETLSGWISGQIRRRLMFL